MDICAVDRRILIEILSHLEGDFAESASETKRIVITRKLILFLPLFFIALAYLGDVAIPPENVVDAVIILLIPLSIWVAYIVHGAKMTIPRFIGGRLCLIDHRGVSLRAVQLNQVEDAEICDIRGTKWITLNTKVEVFKLPLNRSLECAIVEELREIDGSDRKN